MVKHIRRKMFSRLKQKLGPVNVVTNASVRDVRFPTSDLSDAMHKSPNFSAAYVVISVQGLKVQGHGLTFTEGRGTEIVVSAIQALLPLLLGKPLVKICTDFGTFWHSLTNESQLRWIGPEKGAVHLAVAAIVNALWDLWAKIEEKPVWRLLVEMSPEEIVSLVDFRYLSDALTKEEALEMLRKNVATRGKREAELLKNGYPAYTTSIGWISYSDEKVKAKCRDALGEGFTGFKMKVGQDAQDNVRRAEVVRNEIGYDSVLMMDANQIWEVDQSIEHMSYLVKFKPLWIEEPTSPDDILGHAKIRKELKKFGIGVATGECCHNRVMFKQFLQSGAMDFCQIDCCRLGGVNEVISVLLMAAKFEVPVCPHAGGVGLCEYVQHLSIFDYICVSATLENRMIEYADHLHEHFVYPVVIRNGCYIPPEAPGYSQMRSESLTEYEFPDGPVWRGNASK